MWQKEVAFLQSKTTQGFFPATLPPHSTPHRHPLLCLTLFFSVSLSSPLLPAFYFAEVKLSPGVCQVSSDSLKVRGHASPGPVPVGSPISQNRLGRWDGQWEWQGGQFLFRLRESRWPSVWAFLSIIVFPLLRFFFFFFGGGMCWEHNGLEWVS